MKEIQEKLVALIEELDTRGPKESNRTHLSLNLAILALKNALKHVAKAQREHNTDMGGERHPLGDDDEEPTEEPCPPKRRYGPRTPSFPDWESGLRESDCR